jgi:hypothetical protein
VRAHMHGGGSRRAKTEAEDRCQSRARWDVRFGVLPSGRYSSSIAFSDYEQAIGILEQKRNVSHWDEHLSVQRRTIL